MTPEQEKLDRWYTYLYKNISWKHATAWKQTLLKDGRITPQAKKFVKIVNYIKRKEKIIRKDEFFIE